MKRQHTTPYLIKNDKVHRLQYISNIFDETIFDETWLQKFIFKYHHAIPIEEIEPVFGPLIPVCRELPTKTGRIDLLFINDKGLLTLVECKLWKNPESRREVVGQILDYAAQFSQWSYENLQYAIKKAEDIQGNSLYELVAQNTDEDIDEHNFVDRISRNLRRGRFLLLIIGDGIRENAEQIADFLQQYAHLNFGFALVEFSLFKLPAGEEGEYFVQPRIVARTLEIEKAVFKIEDNHIVPLAPSAITTPPIKRPTISEQFFFENLKADPQIIAQLKIFFEKIIRETRLNVEPGQSSMKLKLNLDGMSINFGIFTLYGNFYNCDIGSKTETLGQPQIGEEYLTRLAQFLENGFVYRGKSSYDYTVKIKVKDKKNGRLVTVAEMMAVQDKWLELVQKTVDEIVKLIEA